MIDNRYFILSSLIIPFLPFGILNSLIIFCWFILFIGNRKMFIVIGITFIYLAILYIFSNPFFNISNYLISFISWLPFLIIIFDKNIKYEVSPSSIKWLNYLFYFESAIAIFQLLVTILIHGSIDTGFGDYIQGSLNLLSPINEEIGFNNQLFIIAYILLYIIIRKLSDESIFKNDIKLILLVFVLFSSSVLHIIIVFFVASVASNLKLKKIDKLVYLILTVIILFILMLIFKQNEYNLLLNSLSLVFNIPKIELIRNFFADIRGVELLIGFGPGNGVDRVLFYLVDDGYSYPSIDLHVPANLNEYANQYISYKTNVDKYGNSTLFRPFSSLISIIYDFGLVGTTLIGITLVKAFKFDEITKFLIFFIIGIAFFETYLELPVVSVMFLIVLKSKLKNYNFKLIHS